VAKMPIMFNPNPQGYTKIALCEKKKSWMPKAIYLKKIKNAFLFHGFDIKISFSTWF
jgi:hypothetical protein